MQVEQTFTRPRELCQQLGLIAQLIAVLEHLGVFYAVRGDLQAALEAGQELLSLTTTNDSDPLLRISGHGVIGQGLVRFGDFAKARIHFEQAIALYGNTL